MKEGWNSIYPDLYASVLDALNLVIFEWIIMIWKIIWNYFSHLFGLAVIAFNHNLTRQLWTGILFIEKMESNKETFWKTYLINPHA